MCVIEQWREINDTFLTSGRVIRGYKNGLLILFFIPDRFPQFFVQKAV